MRHPGSVTKGSTSVVANSASRTNSLAKAPSQDLDGPQALGWTSLLWPALGVLAACGMALFPGLQKEPLQAKSVVAYDTDLDGLPDSQEVLLGTSPLLRDTDIDGYSDAEEVLLGSSPYLELSVPGAHAEVSTSVTPRLVDNAFHLLFSLYAEDGNLANKTLDITLVRGGQFVSIPLDRLLPMADIGFTTLPQGGEIMTIDLCLPLAAVAAMPTSTWIASAGLEGSPDFLATSSAKLSVKQGIVFWERTGHLLPPTGASTAGSAPAPTPNLLVDVAHEPMVIQDSVPPTFTPGQICVQRSMITGADGPFLFGEVVDAGCQSGWASYCDTQACEGLVGTFTNTVDPTVIIGG